MRITNSFRTLVSVLIASALTVPAIGMAQSLPDASFTSTSTAFDGSMTYCGALWNFLGLLGPCQTVEITPANSVTEGASGTANNVATNIAVMAGTTQVATIGASNDAATDSDTSSNDSGNANSNEQVVSIFNGAISYAQLQVSDTCVASAPDPSTNTTPVTCTPQVTGSQLEIMGKPVFSSPTYVPLGAQVPLQNIPITVNGVSLILNGEITLGDLQPSGPGGQTVLEALPGLHIMGQACSPLGCELGSMNVDFRSSRSNVLITDTFLSSLGGIDLGTVKTSSYWQ